MKDSDNTYLSVQKKTSYPGALENINGYYDYVPEVRIGWFDPCIDQFTRICALSGTTYNKKFQMKKNRPRNAMRHIINAIALMIMFSFASVDMKAQNFRNIPGGTYNGPGLFRVKNDATGLPDTVTGTFEYFGSNQQVVARNFENLLLTGDSTKTTSSLNILNTFAVADGVRFRIDSLMTLEKFTGRITNETGIIIGRVSKSVDLN